MTKDDASAADARRSGRWGDGRARFRSTPDAEARLLVLIDHFSRKRGGIPRALEGRVKLAKLDFLLRYPHHLGRVLANVGVRPAALAEFESLATDDAPLDSRMMRYRYGPWDPSYFAVLGGLIGRGLVETLPLPGRNGFGYRTTERGASLAAHLAEDESFAPVVARAALLRRYLDLSGSRLKDLIYDLPEVSDATWHEDLK